ncbi:MAG: hypothetical protein ACO1OB_01190 [Archangium sp.]
MRTFVLLAVMSWPAVTLACDDGAPVFTFVGKLKDDRLVLREERFEKTQITLHVFDLRSGKVTTFAEILRGQEPADQAARLRAARWKEAQAKLEKEGLQLETLTEKRLPVTQGGVTFTQATSARGDDSGCSTVELRAKRGNESVKVDETGYCGSSDITRFRGLVLVDGYAIPTIDSGCLDGPDRWLHRFVIADVFTKKK